MSRPLDARGQLAIRELGRRTISATFGNAIAFAITEAFLPDNRASWLMVLGFGAVIAIRIVAHHSCLTAPARRLNWALLAIGSGGSNLWWGLRAASALAAPHPGMPALLFGLTLCAFGIGSVINAAPSAWFQRFVLSALVLPPMIGAWVGGGDRAIAAIVSAFFAFCLVMGAFHTRSFWDLVAASEAQRAANEQLRAEISRRLEVEVELRQAQKLEAIGCFFEWLSNEINTPVQFISDSCTFIGEGMQALASGVADYRRLIEELAAGRITGGEAQDRAAQIDEARDLAFIAAHLGEANALAIDGLQRVAKIVRATKDFAREAGTDKAPTDLNAAIESTLVICRHETSAVAEVVTDLGALPPVMGHVAELNQAFLNIILNAAQAIGDAPDSSTGRGTISIKTWAEDAWVRVAIGDTCPGIAADVLDKIFEPFFTTKPVGKGSGQGLAVARSIVVGKHGGKLDVSSRAGATTFTIALPV